MDMKRSSAIYMVSPLSIWRGKAYKMLRSREKAYRSHEEHKNKSAQERATLYDQFKEKIR